MSIISSLKTRLLPVGVGFAMVVGLMAGGVALSQTPAAAAPPTGNLFTDMNFSDAQPSDFNDASLPYRDNAPLQSVREPYVGGGGYQTFTIGKDAPLNVDVSAANYPPQAQLGGTSFTLGGSIQWNGLTWTSVGTVYKTYEGDFDGLGRKNDLAVIADVNMAGGGAYTMLLVGSATDNTVPLTPVALLGFYLAFGYQASSVGLLCADVNGDGVDEIIVAPLGKTELDTYYLTSSTTGGGTDWQTTAAWQGPAVTQFGAPWSYSGTDRTVGPFSVSDLAIGSVGVTFSMAAGDIDNDGAEDIVYIASSIYNGTTKGVYRSAYVLYGTRNATTPSYTQDLLNTTSIDGIQEGSGWNGGVGQRAFARFGVTLADINGDGHPEVMIAFLEVSSLGGDAGKYTAQYYDIARLDFNGRGNAYTGSLVYHSPRQPSPSNSLSYQNYSDKQALQIAWMDSSLGRVDAPDVTTATGKGAVILGQGSFIVNGDINAYVITQDPQTGTVTYLTGVWDYKNNKLTTNSAQSVFVVAPNVLGWSGASFNEKLAFESIRSVTINGRNDGFIMHYFDTTTNTDYVRYFDRNSGAQTFDELTYAGRSVKNALLYYALPDIDHDSTYLHYQYHTMFWSDPQIVAAIAAPPYFASLPDPYNNLQNGNTTYGLASSSSQGQSTTSTKSVGAYASAQFEAGVPLTVHAVIEAEADYNHTWTKQTSQTVTYDYKVGWKAPFAQNIVVLSTMAYDVYDYTVYSPDSGSGQAASDYQVVVPHGADAMQYLEISYDQYKQYQSEDTMGVLPDLSGVFTNTPGDPCTYPGDPCSGLTSPVPPALASAGGVVKDGSIVLSNAGTTFPSSPSTSPAEIDHSTETSTESSVSNSVSAKLGAGVRIGDEDLPVAATITAGITGGASWETGKTVSSSKGVYATGEVAGQDKQTASSFKWQLMMYTYTNNETQNTNILTQEFPVVTYLLSNVTYQQGHQAGSVTVQEQNPNPVPMVSATSGPTASVSYTVIAPGITEATPMTLEGAPTGMALVTPTITSDQQLIYISIDPSVKAGSYPLTLDVGLVQSNTFYLNVDPGPLTLSVTNEETGATADQQYRCGDLVTVDATNWQGAHQYFNWDNQDYASLISGYSPTSPKLSFTMPCQAVSLVANWHDHANTISRIQAISGSSGDDTITSATDITGVAPGGTVLLWADFGNGQAGPAYVPVDNDADYTASASWLLDGANSPDTQIVSYGAILGSPYAVLDVGADEDSTGLTVTATPAGNNAGAQTVNLAIDMDSVLAADPASIDFPDVTVNDIAVGPQHSQITVTNLNTDGLSPSLTITGISLQGDTSRWQLDSSVNSLIGQTLAAGDSITIPINYSGVASPGDEGFHSGSVVVQVDGPGAGTTYYSQLVIPLTQMVNPEAPIPGDQITIDPSPGDFGSANFGYTTQPAQEFTVTYDPPQTSTVLASAYRDLTNASVTLASGAAFTISTDLSKSTLHLTHLTQAVDTYEPDTATFSVRPKDGLMLGTYTDTVTFSSDDSVPVTMNVTFTVSGTPIVTGVTVYPNSASMSPGGRQMFSATVTGTNYLGQDVTWSATGATDAATSIDSSGRLAIGAAETASTLTVKATSVADPSQSGTASVTLVPLAVLPTITTATLPTGLLNTPYSTTLAATGDQPITWRLASGGLPTGLSLAGDGTISGTPTANGVWTFTVMAANAAGSGTRTLSLTVTSAGAVADAPTLVSKTADSVTVSSSIATNPGNQTVEYAYAATATAPTSGWQDSGTFTGLSAYTQYYFFARAKAALGYASGVASAGTMIQTLDATPPTGQITIGSSTFDSFVPGAGYQLFLNAPTDVKITGADPDSGVKTVEYVVSSLSYASETDAAAYLMGWTMIANGGTFNLAPNQTGYVYARITDNSGNVTYLSSDGIVLYTDAAADTAAITYVIGSGADQTARVTLNVNTVAGVTIGANALVAGTDYTVAGSTITFKASYLDTLAAGDYPVTVSYDPLSVPYPANPDTGSQAPATTSIDLTVTSTPPPPGPNWAISLDASGTYTFSSAAVGYPAQTPLTVTVTNAGQPGTGDLAVALSGSGASAFSLSTATISSIAVGGKDSFTVQPNTGLSAGTYTATVTVSGPNVTSQTFDVSFAVDAGEATPSVTLTGADVAVGADVTLNATVSGPGATPTGTVTFKEGSVVLAADVPLVNGSASYTVTAPSTGSHDYTAEYSGQPGFYSAASGSATVNVAKADPAYTAPTNLAATYGDTLASVTLPSGWTWDDVGLVGQVGDQAHTATYTPSDTANYNTVSGISLTVTVQPLAITVTANDQHKYVGAPDPALTYTVNPPLIGSDTLAGSLKYTGSDVGTYDIVQDAPFSNSNYTITFVKGTMTISSASSVQDVIQKILSLPNPVVTWADADKVAAATNAYNALSSSDKAQIPQDVLAKLTTAQSQSGPVNRTDTTNGGAVSGANLPWYIRIEITPIPQADSRFSGVGGQAPGKSLLALYDIKLVNTLTSATYQLPAGTSVTVELDKVPLSGATGIAVVHEKADGTLETINATVSGTKLTFTASSFSLYGVTAAPAAPAAAPSGQMYVSTGGSIANQSDVTIWLVLITLIGAAYLLRRSVKATSKDSYITIMMMD